MYWPSSKSYFCSNAGILKLSECLIVDRVDLWQKTSSPWAGSHFGDANLSGFFGAPRGPDMESGLQVKQFCSATMGLKAWRRTSPDLHAAVSCTWPVPLLDSHFYICANVLGIFDDMVCICTYCVYILRNYAYIWS